MIYFFFSLSLAFIIGLFIGVSFQKGRACTNTAFRNLFLIRNMDVAIIFIVALLILIIGYQILSFNIISNVNFISGPIALSYLVPIGSFIFGIGMVFAGGCAGGTCYRIGEGNGKALLALVGYVSGIFIILLFYNYFPDVPSIFEIKFNGSIPSLEMIVPRWIWTLIFIIVSVSAVVYFLKKKNQYLPHLLKNWSPIKTGIIIGILAVLARISSMLSGRNFGVSTVDGLTEIFSPLFALFDDSLSFGFGWAAIFIIGWILGSFFSSLESKEFEIKIPNRKEVWRFFGGGLLLGIGAMLAGGCNIGHILGGIPELGLSSLIAIIFMALGNLLASRIFYVKFNNPLPVSSQLG
ncbi:MAG: hypothetical protein HeimC3_22710 [Candidatus Heimdallarchaeota archaeon LC_3]|nr:MAG: hypothetical protein HeimC3_22710 [Candidatus Heimdallarchaeota archaeon LC_3]